MVRGPPTHANKSRAAARPMDRISQHVRYPGFLTRTHPLHASGCTTPRADRSTRSNCRGLLTLPTLYPCPNSDPCPDFHHSPTAPANTRTLTRVTQRQEAVRCSGSSLARWHRLRSSPRRSSRYSSHGVAWSHVSPCHGRLTCFSRSMTGGRVAREGTRLCGCGVERA